MKRAINFQDIKAITANIRIFHPIYIVNESPAKYDANPIQVPSCIKTGIINPSMRNIKHKNSFFFDVSSDLSNLLLIVIAKSSKPVLIKKI